MSEKYYYYYTFTKYGILFCATRKRLEESHQVCVTMVDLKRA